MIRTMVRFVKKFAKSFTCCVCDYSKHKKHPTAVPYGIGREKYVWRNFMMSREKILTSQLQRKSENMHPCIQFAKGLFWQTNRSFLSYVIRNMMLFIDYCSRHFGLSTVLYRFCALGPSPPKSAVNHDSALNGIIPI